MVNKSSSILLIFAVLFGSIAGKNLSTGAKIAIGVGVGAGATLLTLFLIFHHITQNN